MAQLSTRRLTRDLVAIILAIGLATAMNIFTLGVLYDALTNPDASGLSENATQILTGWGGGVIGILGAVFGYEAGASRRESEGQGLNPPREQAPTSTELS